MSLISWKEDLFLALLFSMWGSMLSASAGSFSYFISPSAIIWNLLMPSSASLNSWHSEVDGHIFSMVGSIQEVACHVSKGIQLQLGEQVPDCTNVCTYLSLRTVEVSFEIFLWGGKDKHCTEETGHKNTVGSRRIFL